MVFALSLCIIDAFIVFVGIIMLASHLPTFYLHVTSYPSLEEQHRVAQDLFTVLQGPQKGILADYSPWGLGVVLDSCPHICVSLDHTQAAKDLWHLIGSPVESQVYFNYCWSKKQDNDQDGPGFNRHENMTRITLNERHYTDIAKNAHFQWYEKVDGKNVLKTHTFKPRGLNPYFRMY